MVGKGSGGGGGGKYYDNKKKKGTDHRDMVDGKSKIEIKEHWKYLKQELDKAIDDNDPMRIDKTRKELETFKDDYFKLFRPGGKSRQFIDDTKKNQDRIFQLCHVANSPTLMKI